MIMMPHLTFPLSRSLGGLRFFCFILLLLDWTTPAFIYLRERVFFFILACSFCFSGGLVEQADDRSAVQQLHPRGRADEEGLDRHVPEVQASGGG